MIGNLQQKTFTRKSFVNFFLFNFISNSPINWSGTSNRKLYKRIPLNFDLSSFYKEFPCIFFFTWKSFVKFFPTFKLEIEFYSHKKVVSPKLENCAHLYIVNFMCAKFQQNQRTFFFTWKSFVNFSQLSNLESDFFLILQKKPPMFQNIRNLFVLNFIWANFQQN